MSKLTELASLALAVSSVPNNVVKIAAAPELPQWKLDQLKSRIRARAGRMFSAEALQPGHKVKFNGSPTTYHVAANGAIVRDRPKRTKAERKAAKRMRVADRHYQNESGN